MNALWTLLAIAAPWTAGTAAVRAARRATRYSLNDLAGGWLVGQMLVMGLLYASLRVTGAGHARVLVLLLLAAAVALEMWVRGSRRTIRTRHASDGPNAESAARPVGSCWRNDASSAFVPGLASGVLDHLRAGRIASFLLVLLALSVAAKLILIVGAAMYVPSRSNDAVSIWLFKAKTLAILDRMPTDPADDYYLGGSNPRYPIFLPLLAAWTPMVAGEWSEGRSAAPWPLFYVNLVLLTYCGLHQRIGRLPAALAAYATASLPLLVIHAYRPGYADLPLAVFLAATVVQLFAWRFDGRRNALILGLLFAAAAACMKREGGVLAALVAGVLVLSQWRSLNAARTTRMLMLIAAAALVLAVALLVDVHDVLAALGAPAYESAAWRPLVRHAFDWSSFALLFWVASGITVYCLVRPRACADRAAPWLVLALAACVAGIFVLTPNVRFALNDQTPSRTMLQIAPTVIICLSIALFGRAPSDARPHPEGDHAPV